MESPQLAAATAISCAHTLVRRRSRTSLGGANKFSKIFLFWGWSWRFFFLGGGSGVFLFGESCLLISQKSERDSKSKQRSKWVHNSQPSPWHMLPEMAKITSLILCFEMITTNPSFWRRPCYASRLWNSQWCDGQKKHVWIEVIYLHNRISFISSPKIP